MGYRRKIYHLTWEPGADLHGLEVSLTGLSVERIAKLAGLAAGLTGETPLTEQLGKADELFAEMSRCLVAWNLEDHEGNPVPVTREALADQDVMFVVNLALTWMEAVASVGNPLPRNSNGGGKPMPEESIPMAPLSTSPAN